MIQRHAPDISSVGRIGEKNSPPAQVVVNYEDRLAHDMGWGLNEAGKIFEGRSEVQKTLRKIADSLKALGIDYAIVGGMALFRHGFRRFTEDVDVLVTGEGLSELHRQLHSRGYLPPFEFSKSLRDTDNGVKIDFFVAGKYPGDGKPKPVVFPNPSDVGEDFEGVRYVDLATLLELKLASGMSNVDRLKDLADVLELIKIMNLPIAYAEELNPYVRDKFIELWNASRPVQKRYGLIWSTVTSNVDMLQEILAGGVIEETRDGLTGDQKYLVTTDPDIARKYGMHDESEFMDRVSLS